MKEILLTQNKVALVDDDIYRLVEFVPFHAVLVKKSGKYYARTNRSLLPNKTHTFLHWIVIQPSFNKSFQITFKDGNSLNCQRYNLDYIERSRNAQINSKNQNGRKKISKYLGVSFCGDSSRIKKWSANIKHNGTLYRLGRFVTEDEAAESYNKKAIELFGNDAKLNIINKEK